MQALFFMDARQESLGVCLPLFCQAHPPSAKSMPFFLRLVNGVTAARSEIDAVIERFSSHWKVSRMSGVDRNVLRLAVFEMLCCDDIPVKVSINEAIDIGKRFGTDDSGSFINGILDSIHAAMDKEAIRIHLPNADPVSVDAEASAAAKSDSRRPESALERPAFRRGGVVRRRRLDRPNDA